MLTAHEPPVDGVWMSVTEAARERGVSKQALSKRLKKLGAQVATRRDGQQLMLNVAQFDMVTGANADPAQSLRNRAQDRPPENTAQQDYTEHKAKLASYDAEMARLKLDEMLGRVVPVAEVEAAMVRCAEKLVRGFDQIPALSDDPAVRAALKDKVRELRQVLADEMKMMAKGAMADEGQDT